MARRRHHIREVRQAGTWHQVVTVASTGAGKHAYRRQPCDQCPWRVDQTGGFPPEAFRHSARTAHDAAMQTFACHMSGTGAPATCAGFLLRNAAHNVRVRIALATGDIDLDKVSNGGHDLHADYRAMAVANGVPADDPALARCRGNDDPPKREAPPRKTGRR